MEIVQEGTIIGDVDCDCGNKVPLKVTKNGCVYFYCASVVGERAGKKERCYCRQFWGRAASEKMINDYLKGKNHGQSEHRNDTPADLTPATDDAAGIPAKPGDRGILGGVVKFFTE